MLNPLVIIISKDQAPELPDMVYALRGQLPNIARMFVLDRCSDNSAEILDSMCEAYIEKESGTGWEAGAARDFGMSYLNYDRDFLFLDGDRIPSGLTEKILIDAFGTYDICLMKLEADLRPWFQHNFTTNPNLGKYMNDTFTAAFTITNRAVQAIRKVNGGRLFNSVFDGKWGYEDMSMGDLAHTLGFTCGGFPKHVLVNGAFETRIGRDHFVSQMNKRKDVMVMAGFPEPTWKLE